ncbi:uncharacterized protein LOC132624834 [Lycium barbarum]|uniref:uncharacterized protein LOC132624834 n=1 Tax=Lycium barbarum TaxID=112863 RepID=UPI00293F56B0|nr:uncharacterized protein LOC132624834 [Lycium barbarum]XP_060195543.1 uncharacterized protein LOC132624834 [Lycium barbarum]
MDETDQKSKQEESQNKETTATTKEETAAPTNEEAPAASPDLLKSELESLEKMVVEKLNSDETKANIESAVINPVVSLAQGFAQSAKGLASKVEAKVETQAAKLSSVLQKLKPNGTEELPTSDKHVGESSAADTDNANNNGGHEEAPTTTDKEPLVGMVAQARTSWMNCCGLLEVLARPSDK